LPQAVALIFERIATTEGLMAESTLKAAEAAMELKFQPGSSTKAGLLLFNDLCALAAGEKAPWLAVRHHLSPKPHDPWSFDVERSCAHEAALLHELKESATF